MLGDVQAQRRELTHLSPLHPTGRIAGQVVLAAAALARSVDLDRVRRRHQRDAMPRMALLAATLLATLLPQTLGLASHSLQSIAGGRLAAVVAVLESRSQALLELLHLSKQRLHLLAQSGILGSERDLFFWRHAPSLPAAASPS
jgi:hypothetical protein